MWSLLIFSVFSTYCVQGFNVEPQVTISQGTVIGSYSSYYEFYGIPYAASPEGTNRFKAPGPAPMFATPYVADNRDIRCIRPLGFGYIGTEDCLALDIHTPTLNQTSRLPVMVWIKGTEFEKVIEPELSFKNFIEKDVVIVKPNFRESIFGFLCLGTPDAPGNAGLKDIIAALEWVQQNIAAFGGDPDNVTVFGHGSGGALVDILTLSKVSQGLLHRVISQSGTAMAPWGVTRDNLKYAIEVAEALGHRITDLENLTDAFRRTSAAAIMAVISELEITDNSLPFAPCIEREVSVDSTPFLTKSPFEILSAGEQLQVPMITGFVDVEGTIRADEAVVDNWLEKMDESFNDFLQSDLSFASDEEENRVADEIKSFYFGNSGINMTNINNYLSYHGDTMILVSSIREARMRVASSNASVYLYQFSYKGGLGAIFQGPIRVEEAAHSEDLSYLFHDDIYNVTSVMDLSISDILVERWTNFAKYSVPFSDTSFVPWRPVSENNTYYLRVLNDQEINTIEGGSLDIELENPHPITLAFWQEIYNNYFKDARGRWSVMDRNEEDDVIDVDNVDPDDAPSTDNDNDIDNDNNNNDDNNSTGSASTFMGYTFSIIVLFSILNMLHMSLILS